MDKKVKPITIVNLVLVAIVFILVLVSIGDTTIEMISGRGTGSKVGYLVRLICSIICDVGLVLSGIYLIMGHEKQAASFYKGVLCIIGVMVLMQILIMYVPIYPGMQHECPVLMIVTLALTFIGLMVLAFVKDLGRTKTIVIFFLVLAAYGVFSVVAILDGPFIFFKACNHIAQFLLILSFGFLIQGKYADKAARGRKV